MMQISDLADRAGVTTRTIRYYEELGLIRPQMRTEGGFRLYSDEQLRDLYIIQNLKSLGFGLDYIRDLFGLKFKAEKGGDLARALLEVLEEQQEEIDKQIAHYRQMKEKNNKAIGLLKECAECSVKVFERDGHRCELYWHYPEVPDPEKVTCARKRKRQELEAARE